MKFLKMIVVGCTAYSTLNVIAREVDIPTVPGNTYAAIGTRNLFGLVSPPSACNCPPVAQPPKITVTGFYSVLGRVSVLFKVSVKSGEPAKDRFYDLHEGQSEDDVEIVRIDEPNGVVTFKNQGLEQDVPIAASK